MRYEYLLFHLIVLAGPGFVGLLRAVKRPYIPAYLWACLLVGLPFIIWDMFVTGWFWNFNTSFISGVRVCGLPIEEMLFFLTVPYACLFLWVNLPKKKRIESTRLASGIAFVIMTVFAVISIFKRWPYSLSVAGLSAILLVIDVFKDFKKDLRRVVIFELLVVCTTAIFNGYLTWRPVVTYDAVLKSGVMIGTIPVEDFIYGLILVNGFIWVYEFITKERE